jgi:hypothetical protein
VRPGVVSLLRVVAFVAMVAFSSIASAQGGGKPTTGNPTPGVEQPASPNVADRVTLTGCVQAATRRAETSAAADSSNTPSDSRFELTKAESTSPAVRVTSKTYRLEGIDSQFSPFVGAKVEITGAIKGAARAPTLLAEFVQRIAATCS